MFQLLRQIMILGTNQRFLYVPPHCVTQYLTLTNKIIHNAVIDGNLFVV